MANNLSFKLHFPTDFPNNRYKAKLFLSCQANELDKEKFNRNKVADSESESFRSEPWCVLNK
jgi:hypothetical protein